MLKIKESKNKELCKWPGWLDKLYANPDKLIGRVRIFSHPQHGHVYALGPSEGIWDDKTSMIDVYWYDSKGQWLGMDRQFIPTEQKNKLLSSFQTFQSAYTLASKNKPSFQVKVDNLQNRRTWWQMLKPVCGPSLLRPSRCLVPKFVTPTWSSTHFGEVGHEGKRRSIPISQLRIDQYQHSQLGTIYAIQNQNLADAHTPWFDHTGQPIYSSYIPGWHRPSSKQIAFQEQWNQSIRWIGLCK